MNHPLKLIPITLTGGGEEETAADIDDQILSVLTRASNECNLPLGIIAWCVTTSAAIPSSISYCLLQCVRTICK